MTGEQGQHLFRRVANAVDDDVVFATGTLVQKSGLTDLRSWAGENYGERTPWGEHDQQAIITTVESAGAHPVDADHAG